MSTFRKELEIVLDGEPFKVRTNGSDQLRGELELGESPAARPAAMGMRVAFVAFRRTYPDHPAAKAFGTFVDVLDDINDLDPGPDDLDPTRPADTAG
jgi:hypothetical protein